MFTLEEGINLANQYAGKVGKKCYVILQPETVYEMVYEKGYRVVSRLRDNQNVVYETNHLASSFT
ncbi:hypothetical protein [Bacillus sp. V5-8f]|uniref:hypothetical protein n=1 Tax=Bacillus sp. V5-8f TaxID=2053044 RepID=UPI000C785A93|nr:hypothetical protein [Bacillus sp. V5-8f]PLT35668.1 hypothetical protein CUU64_03460 [Bacillus sp. V5-8f]